MYVPPPPPPLLPATTGATRSSTTPDWNGARPPPPPPRAPPGKPNENRPSPPSGVPPVDVEQVTVSAPGFTAQLSNSSHCPAAADHSHIPPGTYLEGLSQADSRDVH